MGFDQPRPLGAHEFGSGTALSTWLAYMQPMLANVPQAPIPPMPQGLIQANGDYYFSEYPPGQNVAALDLNGEGSVSAAPANGADAAIANANGGNAGNDGGDGDAIGSFLNRMWSNIKSNPGPGQSPQAAPNGN